MALTRFVHWTALLASLVSASPLTTVSSSKGVAVYWGFGKERSLASYCQPGQDINILIIGAINALNGGPYLSGYFSNECNVNTDGTFDSTCADLAQDIQTCQKAGVKIFAGFSSTNANQWAINGTSGASTIASQLWMTYGGDTSQTKIPRPFGSVKVDGFDFDVENNPHNQSQAYLGDLINDLRGLFSQDRTKTYYVSGAPQCGIPDPNQGISMMQAKYDYIWIQFYNNACSAADLVKNAKKNPNRDGNGVGGDNSYNLAQWPAYLAHGASSNAQLYVGLPASTKGAEAWDYLTPSQLVTAINASKNIMSGVMLWNTDYSDANTIDGCTYAQQVAHVISTGKTC